MNITSTLRGLAALGLCLLLAACNNNRNPFEVVAKRCPALAVAHGTGTLHKFASEEKAASDLMYDASIGNLDLVCDQDDDVISNVYFTISLRRGPALPANATLTVPYYVAVVRDNAEIVAKQIYEVTFQFGPDGEVAAVREEIVQRLPTIEQARRYDYEILVGFQLSPSEAAFNLLK